jgi:hypothetical protein
VRPSIVLLAGFLVCGCAPRADQVFTAPDRLVTGSSGAEPGYAIKLVRGKQAPAEVVGDDGSLCRLTPERFAKVDVGEWLACEWSIAPDTTAISARLAPHLRIIDSSAQALYVSFGFSALLEVGAPAPGT